MYVGTRRAAITAGPGGSSGSGGSPCAINGELPVGELVRLEEVVMRVENILVYVVDVVILH